MNSEQCDSPNADLVQAHDSPWTLHHDQSLMQTRNDVVKAVQDLAFRQARGKLPLPILPDLCRIKPATGIADRVAFWVVEPDCDAAFEESSAMIGPDLKVSGGLDIDFLVCEQGCVRIEPQLSGIGLIGTV